MQFKLGSGMAFMFFFCALAPFSILGQDNLEEGFVILNNNDTVPGLIRDRKEGSFGKLFKKIKFRGKRGKSRYGPEKILGYKKGPNIFESIWIESSGLLFNTTYSSSPQTGEKHFLKVVERGYLTYYHWEFVDSDSGYIDNIGLFKKRNNNELVRVSQGIFGLRKKSLAKFFGDCNDLAEMIMANKIKDPMEIARFYNNWREANP